jgi:hypothetical protein
MFTLLLSLSLAQAKREDIPLAWKEGTALYRYPGNWLPKGFPPSGVQGIEAAADSLHYPFYVILIRELPGSGDGLTRLQDTTDSLMAKWGSQGMDLSKYSVFSVAWSDGCDRPPDARSSESVCKYFLNTGSYFINGPAAFLPSRDHPAYTKLFVDTVITTPQDPYNGILKVMNAVDTMLWDKTDPAKLLMAAEKAVTDAIALRQSLLKQATPAEQASYALSDSLLLLPLRKNLDELYQLGQQLQEENQQLQQAIHARLQAIEEAERTKNQLLDALASDARYLPPDISPYTKLAAEAKNILERKDEAEIAALNPRLDTALTELKGKIAENYRAHYQKQFWRLLAGGVVAGMGLVGLTLFLWRRAKAKAAQAQYQAERDGLAQALDNAAARYTSLELDNRESLAVLEGAQGRTEAERSSVTEELDSIYAGIRALEAHLDGCDQRVARARTAEQIGLFHAALFQPFSYNTNELQKDDLFGGETHIIQIDPKPFMEELQNRFTAMVARRDRLVQAAEIRFSPARELFPHTVLDSLFAALASLKLSESWVSDHPLFGDDASDLALYQELDALRSQDPLAYQEQLEALKSQESAILQRVELLQKTIGALAKARLDTPPVFPPCVLKTEDDPVWSFRSARTLEEKARGVLAAEAVAHNLDRALEAVSAATSSYLKAREQAAMIQQAVETLDAAKAALGSRLEQTEASLQHARNAVEEAKQVHAQATLGLEQLSAAEGFLTSARQEEARVRGLVGANRILDARRVIEKAGGLVGEADKAIQGVEAFLRQLEDDRKQFASRSAGLEADQQRLQEQLRSYGGGSLESFIIPAMVGALDYRLLNQHLDTHYTGWNQQVRLAKAAYEERQRQEREEAERRRRAAEAARRAAAQSRHSSWKSSSSSSSFGSSRSSFRSSGGGGSSGSRRSSGGGGGW